MILEEITKKYERPLIGIIGASSPLPNYDSDDAYRLGYELRRIVSNRGTLFTGGVSGVGVDVYQGIVGYCVEKSLEDKFFVLFPEGNIQPSQEYFDLIKSLKNSTLKVERAGKDFEERRLYMSAIADALVLMNGSSGTVDEALKGLILGKPLVCLQNSGGAAEVIAKLKRGEIEIPLKVDKDLIVTCDSITDVVNYLSNECLYKLGENSR